MHFFQARFPDNAHVADNKNETTPVPCLSLFDIAPLGTVFLEGKEIESGVLFSHWQYLEFYQLCEDADKVARPRPGRPKAINTRTVATDAYH
jgi:hypothetical protein